jgi:ankyrin repeat protein
MGWMHLSKLLLERGAAVNAVDAVRARRAARRCACLFCGVSARPQERYVVALCAHAFPSLSTQALDTPLHDAASAGDAAIVSMLLAAGARAEARATVRAALPQTVGPCTALFLSRFVDCCRHAG